MTTTATAAAAAWPAAKVRQTFTDYFKAREHVIFPSSPVIPPAEETTLLFTNAGMNQFKSIFVGTCAPDSPMGKLKSAGRVANSQKCIRAGGKHNDLDDVGKDTYHHTFFEMLGNWSFGNYFKTEAIEWAWDLLTNVYGLDPSRLYATYFGGNQEQNLPADDEARQLWLRFLPAERVLPFGMKDNFWEMGDTGPCGPCTEIHYDRLGGRDGAKLVNNDDPTLIEIWNLVFMQFNRDEKGGKLTPLPAPCVDTGMGFERLVSVLQDVKSNYDTDVWDLIFSRIHQVTGYARPYQGGSSMEEPDIAYRVIADHIRTLTFALVDGGAPSKDGRGFVLRRIIRRAIRYGREILGAKVGFFSELVDAVSESLGHAFPEVADARQVARAKAVLRGEELLFDRTWEQGLKHFTAASAKAVDGVIAGQDAFILHDRYGFPIDLTQIMAERSRLRVDMAQYESIMEHKKRNASGDKMTARRGVLGVDQIHHLETALRVAGTDDAAKYSWEPTAAKVLAVYNIATQQFVDSVAEYTEAVALVLDRTNFYAESGGQVGDQGHLELPGGKVFLVEDTQKYGAYVAHVGAHQGDARIAVGDSVGCSVDYERRKAIAANHTTTHILNHALREVLIVRPKNDADKVDQKGSLVDERVLRFDFSWGSKLAEEQLAQVEEEVNRQIREGRQVFTQEVAKEEADKICSLRSVFGEKYPAFVRVVSVGRDIKELLANPSNPEWHNYSVEFCGGTHLANSSEAEVAVVIGETALGGNVRRIVLYTQQQARDSIQLADELKAELATIAAVANLKERDRHLGKFGKRVDDASIPVVRKAQLRESIQAAFEAMKKEQKERQAHVKEFGAQIGEQIVKELEASPAPFVVAVLNDYNPSVAGEREATNEAIKVIDKKAPTTAHLLINKDEETAAVTATVPKDKAGQLDAGEWVRTVCGKGGGKPTSAQGAGLPVAAVAEAVEKAKRFAAERLQK